MSEEKKKMISEIVETLKPLDKPSLLLIKSGAEMLKAREELDNETQGLEPATSGCVEQS